MIMGYFFFISGYLFFKDYEGISSYKKKLISRFKTLVIPYLIWNFFVWIENIYFHYKENGEFLLDFKLDYFLLDGINGISEPVNGPTWYIARIITYVITAPVLWEIIKRKKVWLAVITVLLCYNLLINYTNIMSFSYNLPFYLLGAGLGVHYNHKFEEFCDAKSEKKEHWSMGVLKVLIFSMPFFIVFFADVYMDNMLGERLRQTMHIINRFAAPILFFYCFRKCEFKKKYEVLNYSFFLYCSQKIWFVLLGKVFFYKFYDIPTEKAGWIKMVIILVLDMVIILVCKKFKPTAKMIDILCGARTKR